MEIDLIYDYRLLVSALVLLIGSHFIISFIILTFVSSKIDSIERIINKISPNTFVDDEVVRYKNLSEQEKFGRVVRALNIGGSFWREIMRKTGLDEVRGKTWEEIKSTVFGGVDVDRFRDVSLEKQIRHLKSAYKIRTLISLIWIIVSVLAMLFIVYKVVFIGM